MNENKWGELVPTGGYVSSIYRPYLVPGLDFKSCQTCLSYLDTWEAFGAALHLDIRLLENISPEMVANMAAANNRPDIVELLLSASAKVNVSTLVLHAARADDTRMIDLLYEYYLFRTMGKRDMTGRLRIQHLGIDVPTDWYEAILWKASIPTLLRLEDGGAEFSDECIQIMANRGDYALYMWMYNHIDRINRVDQPHWVCPTYIFDRVFDRYRPRAYDARIYSHIASHYTDRTELADVLAPLYVHAINDGKQDIGDGVHLWLMAQPLFRAVIKYGSLEQYKLCSVSMQGYGNDLRGKLYHPLAYAVRYGRYDILKRYWLRDPIPRTFLYHECRIDDYPTLAQYNPPDFAMLARWTLNKYDGSPERKQSGARNPYIGSSRAAVIRALYLSGVTPATVPEIKWVPFSHGTDGIYMAIRCGWYPPPAHFDCPASVKWYAARFPGSWTLLRRLDRRAGFRALVRSVMQKIRHGVAFA